LPPDLLCIQKSNRCAEREQVSNIAENAAQKQSTATSTKETPLDVPIANRNAQVEKGQSESVKTATEQQSAQDHQFDASVYDFSDEELDLDLPDVSETTTTNKRKREESKSPTQGPLGPTRKKLKSGK
jgi:recombination DNA repair RAD52 pathway protein